MTWLALDTATDRATVAVGRDRETALEAHLDGARRHASAALPMLQRLLDERGMTLADLRGIVIADGPGSFTGLRVGAAIAKALAHSRGVPVFSAPSLMARALAASAGKAEPVVVTSNALRGDVYAAVYRFRPAAVETLVAPRVVAAGELDTIVPRNAIVSGDRPADARDLIGLAG
ncbi:MAG TPA: tRNA (adenosine(37)-N6)-threonylcarbamoyltransferase complex dimerization subunit type 1 TsaB, partial [Gemmatimonadales bacterium]